MAKTISNVLVGVGVLSVHNEHDLAEWTLLHQMAGSYSAHLVKDALSTDRSTHVQFNPTAHTIKLSDMDDDIDGVANGFRFNERTSGGAHYWAQMELRFEQVDGDGWVELTCVPHQADGAWAQEDWDEYTLIKTTPCGFGGQTPDGSSVFEWTLTTLDTALDPVLAAGTIGQEFEDEEAGSGAGTQDYVLTRVRLELWETGGARESWIGDVVIDGHTYVVEPGSVTPGLVLSSPNVEIGYTEDGVTLEYTADEADIEVEEETFPIDRVITKETAAITCNMAESSLFNMDKAMAGSVLSGNVIILGGGVNKLLNLTLEVITPAGFKRTYYMPRAHATGAVGMPYKKGEKTIVPVTFQALKGDEYAVLVVDCAA